MNDVEIYKIPAVARRFAFDDLENRVLSLESSLVEASAESASTARELAEGLENVAGQSALLDRQLAEVQDHFDGLLKDLAAVRAQLVDRVDSIDRELTKARDDSAQQASKLTTAQDRLAEQLALLRAELAKAQADLANGREASAEGKRQLAETQRQVSDGFAGCQARLQALEKTNAQYVHGADALISRIATVEARTELITSRSEENGFVVQEQLSAVSKKLEELQRAEALRSGRQDQLRSLVEKLLSKKAGEAGSGAGEVSDPDDEIDTCRRLASTCVFVIGFARSNTTITTEMLNCATNALILAEANFFFGNHGDSFAASYNRQHV
jgi:chromosome segregation ATPase